MASHSNNTRCGLHNNTVFIAQLKKTLNLKNNCAVKPHFIPLPAKLILLKSSSTVGGQLIYFQLHGTMTSATKLAFQEIVIVWLLLLLPYQQARPRSWPKSWPRSCLVLCFERAERYTELYLLLSFISRRLCGKSLKAVEIQSSSCFANFLITMVKL